MRKTFKILLGIMTISMLLIGCGEKMPKITKEAVSVDNDYGIFGTMTWFSNSDKENLNFISLQQEIYNEKDELIETLNTNYTNEDIKLNDGMVYSEIGWYKEYGLTEDQAKKCTVKNNILSFEYKD